MMGFAAARYIFDTNVLLYRHDAREQAKRLIADDLIRRFAGTGRVVLPAQELAEFSNAALRRFAPPLDAAQVYAQVERLQRTFPVLPLTGAIVLEALRGVRDHRMSYYDAQIWAVARLNQVPVVVSEDFNSGATLDGVTFYDPFAPGAAQLV